MGKIYNFFLDPIGNQNYEADVAEIQATLKKIGVGIKIDKAANGYKSLVLELDESKIKTVTEHQTRNAGRKKKKEEGKTVEQRREKRNRRTGKNPRN